MAGRRYKLWWSETVDGVGIVGVFVEEELCEKVVEIRRVSDNVMSVVFVFNEDVLSWICGYSPQSGISFE